LSSELLRRAFAHPLTAGLDLDDPKTTSLRKNIIASKPFLRAIYNEWYAILASQLPTGRGKVIEIGSGAGYCSQFIFGLIKSEIFVCPDLDVVLDAQQMPFDNGSLRAIVMTNVLHHMPRVECFFEEACRCLGSGGKILMIEPWMTTWSKFVYMHFHHEPINSEATEWSFAFNGPLSSANIALPWILFARDREKFKSRFPELVIGEIRPFLPFRYLLSGGVGMRSLMPSFTYRFWANLEQLLRSQMPRLGMFAFIALERR
jgi:SAM-dependent methyltransferase